MQNYDYLIIGGGLAGTCLALHLWKQGHKACMVDNTAGQICSLGAAGLINPITGRNMVKTWNADEIFPLLLPFYTELEEWLETKLYHSVPIYRPFNSAEEWNDWSGKASDPSYEPYVENLLKGPLKNGISKDELGGILLKQTAYVELPKLLDAGHRFLKEKEMLILDEVKEPDLKIGKEDIRWKDVTAKTLICCQGWWASQSQLWSFLPWRPVKGEIVDLESNLSLDYVFNRGFFLLPKGKGLFRLGSTYENNFENLDPNPSQKELLLKQMSQWLSFPYEVKRHWAGIRPAIVDRRPVIGRHPLHKNVMILNALGAKGVSLLPLALSELLEMIHQATKPKKELAVERFFSLFKAGESTYDS